MDVILKIRPMNCNFSTLVTNRMTSEAGDCVVLCVINVNE